MDDNKVICSTCEGSGKIKGYERIDCINVCKKSFKIKNLCSFERCDECTKVLTVRPYFCPVCAGTGEIEWITELFRGRYEW